MNALDLIREHYSLQPWMESCLPKIHEIGQVANKLF